MSAESTKRRLLMDIRVHHVVGLVVRLALVAFGCHQDHHGEVPYTDVDYHVVTDGASRVWAGGSPFTRHTYRYTPLLAWSMLPNVVLSAHVGKLLFCVLDILAAHLIYATLLSARVSQSRALLGAGLWLYSPVVIGVSTRGSAEAVVVTLVLAAVFYRQRQREVLCGAWLGAAIHVKLYPVIYCLPLYLSLENNAGRNLVGMFAVTKKRVAFVLGVVLSFGALTGVSFYFYGMQYIQEGFLYHLTRVDTRHNFSIWFYFLYLSVDYEIPGLGLVTFVPQFAVVFACGFVFSRNTQELLLGLFCQTVAFVAFNKVVTSQYFLWYLVFVPLIHDQLNMSWQKKLFLLGLWLVTQASWLLPAYLFEFKGMNTFLYMWLESIAFFSCNIYILISVISKYDLKKIDKLA